MHFDKIASRFDLTTGIFSWGHATMQTLLDGACFACSLCASCSSLIYRAILDALSCPISDNLKWPFSLNFLK